MENRNHKSPNLLKNNTDNNLLYNKFDFLNLYLNVAGIGPPFP